MSPITSSSTAVRANTNVNTKPSQSQQKRGHKQAIENNSAFSIYADDKPKSKLVSGAHMDALMARAQAEKAAAATANYPALKAVKEVKIKDAPLPPPLTMPFAGVAAASSGQCVSPGSRRVSSTLSTTSSKSSLSSASTVSQNPQVPAVQLSGSWGNTGPYTCLGKREEEQTIPPPTKAATSAPPPDGAGWTEVTSKKASKNAAPVHNTPAPILDTDEAPKLSRRQKKKEAAALTAARAVPDISSPTISPHVSTAVTDTAPKQENAWSTVLNKKPGKKATESTEHSYIWNESKTTIPQAEKAGRSNKAKMPDAQTDAQYPALKAPNIKVSPFAKPSKAELGAFRLPKTATILKLTKTPSTHEASASVPEVKNNFTRLTGDEYNAAMADWSGQVGAHMSRLFGMVATDSFVKSTLEPAVASSSPAPVLTSNTPVPAVTASKKKKSGAARKKAKKAKAAVDATAAEAAMNEPVTPAQPIKAVDVPDLAALITDENSSAGYVWSVAPIQQAAAVQVSQVTLAIEEKSIAENISSVVPGNVQETIVSEEILENPVITALSENEDLVEAMVHLAVTPFEPFLDIAMCDERFFLQHGFDDVCEDADSIPVVQMNDSQIEQVKPLQDIEMNGIRFCLQFGIEDIFEEEDKVSATDIADSWLPAPKLKVEAAFAELDVDVLRLCDIVQAELLIQQEFNDELSVLSEPSLVGIEDVANAPTEGAMNLIDIRTNQLHMGGISIADMIQGIAQQADSNDTYSKEHIAKMFISFSNREREMIGMGPSMGTSKPGKVLQSLILQNIVRIGRTKLVDFLKRVDFVEDHAPFLSVVQACIGSAENEMASRGTAVGKTVARALGHL